MSFSTSRSALRVALLVSLALGVGPGRQAAAQGPFQPGMRWIDGADLQTPWIPTAVAFAAADNLVWVGAGAGNDRLLAYEAPGTGVAAPSAWDTNLGPGVDLVDVAAGSSAGGLFSLTQRNAPDVFHRISEVSRRDLLQASGGASFAPLWTHDLGFSANGPARMGLDERGELVVVAAWNDQAGVVRVDRIDGLSGALLVRSDLPAAGLDELVLSADGQRAALIVGTRLVVLAADGAVLHDQSLAGAPTSLAIDAAGQRVVVGGVGVVRVFELLAGSYVEVATKNAAPNELAAHVGISGSGETWAVAWWRFAPSDLLRYEAYDGQSHGLLLTHSQLGQLNGLQNSPVGVRLSRDGERIAFASWGKGDGDPEVVLFERESVTPLMVIDLPGSVMDFDLDAEGTRLALVTKNLHANLSSSTGEVRLYDTGERDLTLLAPTLLGGSLSAASRSPGASTTLFLVGVRSAAPVQVPGAHGELSLLRSGRLYIYARPADLAGESLLSLPLPAVSGLIGVEYALQAAARVNGQLEFSETTVDLLFH